VLFAEEADSLFHPEYLKNSPLTLKHLDKSIEVCNVLLHKISIPVGHRSVFCVSTGVYFCELLSSVEPKAEPGHEGCMTRSRDAGQPPADSRKSYTCLCVY
jgi:hypothetical protein